MDLKAFEQKRRLENAFVWRSVHFNIMRSIKMEHFFNLDAKPSLTKRCELSKSSLQANLRQKEPSAQGIVSREQEEWCSSQSPAKTSSHFLYDWTTSWKTPLDRRSMAGGLKTACVEQA